MKFGMAGGSMAATARLDGSGAPLSGRIEVHARRLRLKQLFPLRRPCRRRWASFMATWR